MDFAESQEAVAITAVFDEKRLAERVQPLTHFGQVDVPFDLLFVDVSTSNSSSRVPSRTNDPGLFRRACVDKPFS